MAKNRKRAGRRKSASESTAANDSADLIESETRDFIAKHIARADLGELSDFLYYQAVAARRLRKIGARVGSTYQRST
jgi:hypothetical protein